MSLVLNHAFAFAGCNDIPQNEILVATTEKSTGAMRDDRFFLVQSLLSFGKYAIGKLKVRLSPNESGSQARVSANMYASLSMGAWQSRC
jgi:hypothetical protein